MNGQTELTAGGGIMSMNNTITTRGIIGLLVNQVSGAKAADFAEQCLQVGMEPYSSLERDAALSLCNSNLPPFDEQSHFSFELDDRHDAVFEILEKDEVILQAGYQVLIPSRLFFGSKAFGKYKDAIQALEDQFGTGMPMNQQDIQTMNFGNASAVAYAALIKTGRSHSLTVRVGNRRFWN
jgi:hypothetical protein